MRPPDEPIPLDEPLLHAIGPEHVQGDLVLPAAVDLEGTSVHRLKYCVTRHVPLIAARPDLNGLAETAVGRLPDPLPVGELIYRFFAVDAPSEGDEHHAEIRVNTDPGSRENRARIKSSSARRLLREALASSFRIHVHPHPVVTDGSTRS